MGYHADSLEWLVASADVVVRASVAEVLREPSADDDQRDWATVTLKVHETLKGDAMTVTFSERKLTFDKRYEGWREANSEQLWLFVRNEKFDETAKTEDRGPDQRFPLRMRDWGWSLVRLGPPDPVEKDVKSSPPPVFTLGLQVIEKPPEILAAARAAAKQSPGRAAENGHLINLPREVMQRSGRNGDANSLTVPIDAHLETLARHFIKSPRDFLVRARGFKDEAARLDYERWELSEANLLRHEGVKALAHFKSDDNVALLKPLLSDSASWQITPRDETQPAVVREFFIRKEAYDVLSRWELKVARPVISERLTAPAE
jgi:hypothetical protein